MARRLYISAVLLIALAALVPGRAAASSIVTAKLGECSTEERFAIFETDVRRIKGASRMQVRLTLQTRGADAKKWQKVDADGFGTWSSSAAGVKRYVYTKRLESLVGPGAYRVKADVRWRDAAGEIVERAQRTTAGCRVPDYRADLFPVSVVVRPGLGQNKIYELTVRNDGFDLASPFGLGLTVDGAAQPIADLDGLEPGESGVVEIEAPACRFGAEIAFVVDPRDEVDEADEAANLLRILCPVG